MLSYVHGYLREEAAEKKVYYLDAINLNSEHLLYDFNLQIGDTIQYNYVNSCSGNDLVSGMGTYTFNGISQKLFYIESNIFGPSAYILEGIGSGHGLTGNRCDWVDMPSWCLKRYYNSKDTIDVIYCGFHFQTNISENDEFSLYKIFPTIVSSGELTIQSEKLVVNIDFYNLLGEKVKQEAINNTQQIINVSSLHTGAYIVHLIRLEDVVITKVFVQ